MVHLSLRGHSHRRCRHRSLLVCVQLLRMRVRMAMVMILRIEVDRRRRIRLLLLLVRLVAVLRVHLGRVTGVTGMHLMTSSGHRVTHRSSVLTRPPAYLQTKTDHHF